MEENYNRLRKIWNVLQIPNRTFSKFYNPSENLAIDEVVQRKGDFDTVYSQETQPFWHQNLQTLQPNRLHESLHGK
jgi:arabinogalactan endo-1,4-beta-galactosidase